MKELSIEEKARLYDEALKEAVIAHKDEDRHLKATLERIFPELNIHKKEALAWLEKQSKASMVKEAMRDIEQKAKAFTEANKEQTSEEILADMRGVW